MRISARTTFVTAILAALVPGAAAWAQSPLPAPTQYQQVAKWAVAYDDMTLGRVEGVAFCKWLPPRADCHIKLRNPRAGDLQSLIARGEVFVPDQAFGDVVIRLYGDSPSADVIATPPLPMLQIRGTQGDSATIVIHNGGTDLALAAPVKKRAKPDTAVTLQLTPQPDGSLIGGWRYLADPVTQRDWAHDDAKGARAGIFDTIGDGGIASLIPHNESQNFDPGGFLGMQRGSEAWQPLPPRIVWPFVLEDEAAFEGAKPLYTHSRPEGGQAVTAKNTRTLVIIGSDLPVDGGRPLLPMYDATKPPPADFPERLSAEQNRAYGEPQYQILAVAGADGVSDADQQKFERAWSELSKGMDAQTAAAFRKLDAVLVRVFLGDADPGPMKLVWGTAEASWTLQYGDNTADARFVRIINDKESEPVQQLALPDQVVVEVETGSVLKTDTLPVLVGGVGVGPGPVAMVATRLPGSKTVYRTAPITFVAADSANAASAGTTIRVRKGANVLAGVDRDQTHFLRAALAQAVASEPTSLWLNALQRAAACKSVGFDAADWPKFASQPAETVSYKGLSNAINYGDHAAMLILRDAFLEAMRLKLAELKLIGNAGYGEALDAWYRSMHAAVTDLPNFPLAAVEVTGPGGRGKVAFREGYSEDFRESNFHPSATADGAERYRIWRRQAAREALESFRQTVAEAIEAAEKIDACDRQELLKLTGSGFHGISSRIAPLLMKQRPGSPLSEPDFLARAYVKNLDVLADALAAAKAYSGQVNTAIVAAALVIVPAASGAIWSAPIAVGTQEIGVGTLAGVIGGFALFGYDSYHQIYQTYRQHEEVRFAFGSSAALGLDRYFDAESRKTEWWQTGVAIFSDAVMQGSIAILGDALIQAVHQPIADGIAAWRGARIVASLPKGAPRGIYGGGGRLLGELPEVDLAALRNLSFEEQRDVAMYLLKEQERLSRVGVFGQVRQYANRVFRSFAQKAAGTPAPPPTQLVTQELEVQSLQPIDDFTKTQLLPVDPLRLAKTELASSGLLQVARTEVPEYVLEAATARIPPPTANALPATTKPFPVGAGLPIEGKPWVKNIGGVEITFEIEDYIASGSFSQVYKLKAPPVGLKLDPALGEDLVLKIVKTPKQIEGWKSIPGVKTNIIQRMVRGRNLLRSKGIPQAEFDAFEEAGILVQKRLQREAGKLEFYPGMRSADQINPLPFLARVDKAKQRAVAKLFDQLGDAEIAWLDAHGGNLYLENTSEGWVAKILDQDFIVEYANVRQGVYGQFFEWVQDNKIAWSTLPGYGAVGDPVYTNPRSLMQKVMEHQGWLRYSDAEKRYLPWRLDPEEVKRVMPDLFYVPPPAPPPAPGSLPLKHGWLRMPDSVPPAWLTQRPGNDNDRANAGRLAAELACQHDRRLAA